MLHEYQMGPNGWLPAVVWLYQRGADATIVVLPMPGYTPLAAAYTAQVTEALQNGWHTDAIWAYWAADTGKGQNVRQAPEDFRADNLQAAQVHALAMLTP